MRPVRFLGDSLECLRDFPEDARHDAGYQLEKVQRGEQPDDFKPLAAVGKGVEEIRIAEESGAFRVISWPGARKLCTCSTLFGRSRRPLRGRISRPPGDAWRNYREVRNEKI